LNALFQQHGDKAAFFIVYIEEAHPTDAWQVPQNVEEEILFPNPASLAARLSVAQSCVADLGIEFPALVDDMNNSVEDAYTAWPDRLYLIDSQGRVAYKSKPGPFGFRVKDLEAALLRLEGSAQTD
jgi:hypothetical protein